MQLPAMKRAVDACAQKGIAITAIKSQAMDTNPVATIGEETPSAQKQLQNFLEHAQDPFEARIQAVLSNPQAFSRS